MTDKVVEEKAIEAAEEAAKDAREFRLSCDEVRNRLAQASQLIQGFYASKKDQYLVSAKTLIAGIDKDIDSLKGK
ncbi:MAG: hypothetical protein EOM12_03380 [Verrucomicrobiae bacterium]|nr:hypothetical protein [Verrucomicrobiae bacterium]